MALLWTLCAFWLGVMAGFGVFAAMQMSRDSDNAARQEEIAIGLEELDGVLARQRAACAIAKDVDARERQNLASGPAIGEATEVRSPTPSVAAMCDTPREREVA
jgi:hypothetical protein